MARVLLSKVAQTTLGVGLVISLLFPSLASAAIAFDAADGGNSAGTSLSFTHAAGTLTNGIALVGFQTTGTSAVSGTPTYGGVNMTLIDSSAMNGVGGHLYIYCALTSGGNATVAINSTAGGIWADAATYSGVNQSCTVDAHTNNATASAVTSLTTSLSSITNNDWFVIEGGGARLAVAGTNVTSRHSDTVNTNTMLGDSNAAEPIGSFSQTITFSSTNQEGTVMVALAPAAAVTAPIPPLFYSFWW